MNLTSENVEKIFMDCLFKKGENTENAILVEGITSKFGFHPERIKHYSNDIEEMLYQLPKEFKKQHGGGMSFLNACNNLNGEQWTGFHRIMEQLFAIGMASGKVKCLMPRDMWSLLPGGMPYYVVL